MSESVDAQFALGMVPLAKEVMGRVREMLPPGTHFGVFILSPAQNGEGRVIALTTDRTVMRMLWHGTIHVHTETLCEHAPGRTLPRDSDVTVPVFFPRRGNIAFVATP
jgi:hypothetical protein